MSFFLFSFVEVLFIELIANAIKINKGRLKRFYLRLPPSAAPPVSSLLGGFLSAASPSRFAFSLHSFRWKLQKLLFLSFYTFQFVRISYIPSLAHLYVQDAIDRAEWINKIWMLLRLEVFEDNKVGGFPPRSQSHWVLWKEQDCKNENFYYVVWPSDDALKINFSQFLEHRPELLQLARFCEESGSNFRFNLYVQSDGVKFFIACSINCSSRWN